MSQPAVTALKEIAVNVNAATSQRYNNTSYVNCVYNFKVDIATYFPKFEFTILPTYILAKTQTNFHNIINNCTCLNLNPQTTFRFLKLEKKPGSGELQ